MISICDMIQELVAHEINVKVSREYVQDMWTIHAKKGDNIGIWAVGTDDYESTYLARGMIRKMTVSSIINYFDKKEREKEHEMKNNKQKFTRDDLKPGYIVKLRDGTFYAIQIAGRETLIATDAQSEWEYLSRGWDIDMDSTNHGGKTFPYPTHDKTKDIVEVYGYVQGSENYARCGWISSDHRPLLWSRQGLKKMTVEEIEKELGYKVEIISG